MNYRHGTCGSCGAHFRVPASFQADRAKCKNCGGVVEIGPVQEPGGSAPRPAASRPAAAKPAARPAGSKSEGGTPRRAAAPKPVPARPVTPRAAEPGSAPSPTAGRPSRPAAATGKTDPVRAAAEAAAQRVRSAGTKSSRSTAGRGTAKRPERPARAGARSGTRRHHAPAKKRSYLPMILAFVVLVVIGGAAWWFFMQQDEQQAPAEIAQAPAEEPGAEVAGEAEGAAGEPEETSAPVEEPPAEEGAPAEEAAAEEQPAEEKPAPDPDSLDLSTFPDEEKLPGTSDEDWTQIQEWMASYIDPAAGAAGNRARAKLLDRGRESFPAILNAFKRIDFSTEEGMRSGDLTQRLLTDICNGQNFDWHFSTEPADVLFNKKVVRSWIKAWEQGREFPQAWAKLTKTELADAEKLFEKTGPFLGQGGPIKADSLDDF